MLTTFGEGFLEFTQKSFFPFTAEELSQDLPGCCQKLFGSRKSRMIEAVCTASYASLLWAKMLREDHEACPEQIISCFQIVDPPPMMVESILFYCYRNLDIKSRLRVMAMPWKEIELLEINELVQDCYVLAKKVNYVWRPTFRLRSWNQLYNHLKRQFSYITELLREKEKSPFPLTKFHALNDMEFNEYVIRFPKDKVELCQWSIILKNCLWDYEEKVRMGTVILGLYKEETLKYAAEIVNERSILQFQGMHDEDAPVELSTNLIALLKQCS
jgi:hypothetical protein